MALDRNIIEWSLTARAFKAKSYIEIFNMLYENYRAIYGQNIDLSVETPLGEELRMKAQMFYDMAKLAEDIYYTVDANNARGVLLDNIVAFTSNIVRKTNVQTILTAELKFIGDDIFNVGTINNVYLQDDYGIFWRAIPITGTTLSGANTINPVRLTAGSFGENMITESIVQMTLNGSFYSNQVELTAAIIYEQIGSIAETDEMLRLRKNNTLSYNSVYLLDSIRDYILKNIYSIKDIMIYNANGKPTAAAGVDTAGNTVVPLLLADNTAPAVTVLKHDILVLVQPQIGLGLTSFISGSTPTILSEAIAKVLKRKITPGIATSYELLTRNISEELVAVSDDTGYISVTLVQDYGSGQATERYSFYVVNRYSPQIQISLTKKSNYDPVNTPIRIRNAIFELSKKYTINMDIDVSEILTAVMHCNLDLLNPTFVPTGVSIGTVGSTSDNVKVNNGYWLVDKTAESEVGAADWNIVIL